MIERLFSPFGMPEPKSQARRKRLVKLISNLLRKGFRVEYKNGVFYA